MKAEEILGWSLLGFFVFRAMKKNTQQMYMPQQKTNQPNPNQGNNLDVQVMTDNENDSSGNPSDNDQGFDFKY